MAGPQRSVSYEDHPELGEVPYSCVWAARGGMDTNPDSETVGEVQWFKPERLTSGRRDAFQIMVNGGDDVAFAMVWQEDPKGLRSGEGDGPGDGWSGSNTYNKTDIWYSYIIAADFGLIDTNYPVGGHGDNDVLVGEFYLERRMVVEVNKIPRRLIQAFVAAEDSRAAGARHAGQGRRLPAALGAGGLSRADQARTAWQTR